MNLQLKLSISNLKWANRHIKPEEIFRLAWSLTAFFLFLFTLPKHSNAQDIDFGSFHDYEIFIENVSMGDLEFPRPIAQNSGTVKVELSDAFILEIIGVEYLDVGVTIEANGELYLDGNESFAGDPQKSIPFTLEAAYSNQGQESIGDARIITINHGSYNIGEARFPVLGRQQAPPGPPPTPTTGEFDQSEVNESAFLYLHGEIDVGDVDVGFYSGTIIINVRYDTPPEPSN